MAAPAEPADPPIEIIEHRVFMIAQKKAGFECGIVPEGQQQVDHVARLRPAVDIVAEEDNQRPFAILGALARVAAYLFQQATQKVCAAMNIADRIGQPVNGRQAGSQLAAAVAGVSS